MATVGAPSMVTVNELFDMYVRDDDLPHFLSYHCIILINRPNVVMGGRRSPKLQLQFLHLPCSCCLQETEFGGIRLFLPHL
ncbi:hypothetical protein TNCV_2108441 [Trichonephila clavipes]|nr:hypothetical protein TNCV_2108441 [Trichonephila clavipes]